MREIPKRDRMIKQLSNDLKKEREECKRKDCAFQKYEVFYREVKARSAEKVRQRQQQLEKEQQKNSRRRDCLSRRSGNAHERSRWWCGTLYTRWMIYINGHLF
jgi:hypothetical protein